jgi:hypothetical protein
MNINWKDIVLNLKNGVEITPNVEYWNLNTPGYIDILNLWKSSNFNLSSIKWTNFYPGKHFSLDVEKTVSQNLNINPLRSWISKIDPGFCAPWHWDVDDNEAEYQTRGNLVRYSCFAEEPTPGHIFQLENNYYYNVPCGQLIKWKHHRQWHAAANFGLTPKYMYHILGFTDN